MTDSKIKKKTSSGKRIRSRNEHQILAAATAEFSRKGFDGTRISDIAEAAKLPKANVYYYFSSKEEIYRRLIAQLLQSWDEALQHIDLSNPPEIALQNYIAAKLKYSQQHPAESRLFASEILRGAGLLTKKERQHIREVSQSRTEVLKTWISEGKIAPVNPSHLLLMLWASTQFYADFEPVALDVLDARRLNDSHFQEAQASICKVILSGLIVNT